MSEKPPLVSVLMTAYNREKFISTAIESVLASGFRDFELIIVDDCSTDSTLSIARIYEQQDARVKVYSNESNIGDYPNRNKAAAYATGKYIKYVDSDDYIYPDGLQIMVEGMERFPGSGMGISLKTQDNKQPFPFMLQPKEVYEYQFFGPGLFYISPVSVVFVRQFFLSVGAFLPNRMVSDNHMWFKLSLHYPVVLLSEGIVWTRTHNEQELKDSEKYLREYESIKWQYLLDPLCKLSVQQLKAIKRKRVKRFIKFILAGIKQLRFGQVTSYIECLFDLLKINVKSVQRETN